MIQVYCLVFIDCVPPESERHLLKNSSRVSKYTVLFGCLAPPIIVQQPARASQISRADDGRVPTRYGCWSDNIGFSLVESGLEQRAWTI